MNNTHYRVSPIEAFDDNYIWLITEPHSDLCVVVDPGNADVVLQQLEKQRLKLAAIFITHHHHDHTGGVQQLVANAEKTQQFKIYGPSLEAQSVVTNKLNQGDTVNVDGMDLQFKILAVPGHTLGHIAFYDSISVFCGDTLFAGGCGRMFEGTPEQMHDSLTKLASLPATTNVYCAHEYTLANLAFAQAVEPNNVTIEARIDFCRQQRLLNMPTIPSTIAQELATNPFLRTDNGDVSAIINSRLPNNAALSPVDIFANLRQWKDGF